MAEWPSFMWVALSAALVLGGLGGWLGPLIVQRRQAFLGAGLAHVAFAGVALGLVLQRWVPGIDPTWVAWPFTIIVAIIIARVGAHRQLSADTAIGVAFALAMAIGIVALSATPAGSRDTATYLFGSLLALDGGDMALLGIITAAVIACQWWWPRWAYATFDRDLAQADGLAVARDDIVLSVLLASIIVAGVALVGALLIAALMVVPAAAARLLARTLFTTSLLASVLGTLCALTGVWAAWHLDLPPGPCIVLAAGLVFIGAWLSSPQP